MGNEDSKLSEEEIKKRTIAKMDMEMREKLRKGVQYNSMYRITFTLHFNSQFVSTYSCLCIDIQVLYVLECSVYFSYSLLQVRIIIRGEVNTGKTSLWYRLQGKKFNPTYHPSESIQIAHIPWSYKVTDDNVKVEVWDVVDKGTN